MLNAGAARTTFSQLAASFWAALTLNIVARGQTLFAPMYSIDSYDVARKSFGGRIAYSLSDGRFIRAGIWWLQAQIGFLPIQSISASICAAIPLFIISGFVFAATILEDVKRREVFCFAALFTLHPFGTEYFYYGEVTLATVLAVVFAALAVWSAYRAPPSLIWRCAAAGAVVLALGNYQIVIGHIAAGGLLVLAANLCGSDGAAKPDIAIRLGSFLHRTAALVVGSILYVLCLVLTKHLFPEAASGRAFRTGAPSFLKLHAIGSGIEYSFFPPHGIVPMTISVVTLLGLTLCVFLLLQATWRWNGIAALILALAVVIAIICAAAASLIVDVASLAPRLLSPVALCIAALAVMGFRCAGAGLRVGLVTAFAVVITGYVGADASILFDQRRMNLWDHQEANRIIARLEADPAFGKVTSLAVVGRRKTHSLPLSTSSLDMNTSGLGSPWSKLGLFEQATGYTFASPTDIQWQTAIDYCAHGTVWPLPGSIGVIDGLAVVCLPRG